ncbi:MAG: hypothetical protein QNJ89_09205 [Acidimicrobiia bacterium]|nr:hypothetical protein [Acidimicrobiia bacterium]
MGQVVGGGASDVGTAGRRNRCTGVLFVSLIAAISVGCSSNEAGNGAATTAAPPPTSVLTLEECDGVTELFPVATVQVIPDHSCFSWIDRSIGRAVRGSTGSASVWSRRTQNGTALIVGAIHTLGQGWFGAAGTPIGEAIVNPSLQTGVPRLFLLRSDGSGPDELASPWFGVYNPAIAAERNDNLMQEVLPREDFYVAATDNQKLDVSSFPPVPEPIQPGLVPLYDPNEVTLATPTFAEAVPDSLVLLLGYPNETGELTAAVGRVLDDAAAFSAIATLAELGDPEGAVPYEPDVEMIIEGSAVAGMSGGPVVDGEGRLLGVMVRATEDHGGVSYVRAVRMSHVAGRVTEAYDSLSEALQAAVGGYLER